MTTAAVAFRVHPLDPAQLDHVRATGADLTGRRAERHYADGWEPLRCCLRDARTGERCLLFGYAPPLPGDEGPYRDIGPVFAHARDCGGPRRTDAYPREWRGRPQVLRAYDHDGRIHPATTVHDGSNPVAALGAVLAEPGVAEVHSRNIADGCFMFAAATP